MLKGKNIILCITGGIAAYKAVSLASRLTQAGAHVYPILSKNACRFITPLTLKSITRQKVTIEMFDESDFIPHISLADLADLVVIAPATANIIAKAAQGIADDMISTLLLSTTAPKLIVPAMNHKMYLNPINQANMKKLTQYDFKIIEPETGYMACGTSGPGRFPKIEKIYGQIIHSLADQDSYFYQKKILLSLGGTCEDIDPVRYITNRSSGRTGFAIAEHLIKKGARLTLIAGRTSKQLLHHFQMLYSFVEICPVRSARDMYEAVRKYYPDCRILIMAAAVADYKPQYQDEKIKKTGPAIQLSLSKTTDILKSLTKDPQKIHIGFAAESSQLLENARSKLISKQLDFLVANSVKGDQAAIGTEQSELYLLNKWNDQIEKFAFADKESNCASLLAKIEQQLQKLT